MDEAKFHAMVLRAQLRFIKLMQRNKRFEMQRAKKVPQGVIDGEKEKQIYRQIR
jgi:hypothetical protein